MAKIKEYGHLVGALTGPEMNAPDFTEKERTPKLNIHAHMSTASEYDDTKYRKEEVKRLRKEIKQGEDQLTNWNHETVSKQAMKSFETDLARQKARLMECEAMLDDEDKEESEEEAEKGVGAKGKGSVVGGPYQIRQKGSEFQVVNMETGDVKGTHSSKKKALRQFRALEMLAHDEK